MSHKFNCPVCAAVLRASEDMVGREIRCGACLAVFPVPEPRPEPAELPEPLPLDDDDERDPPRRRPRPPRDDDDPDDPPRRRYDEDYDRDPYPRTRRRRRPPPRGRGAGFWILVTFGILFVGCVSCCGIGYLALPGESWRTYQSDRGGFSADLPLEPDKDMKVPGMKPEPNIRTEGGILYKRGECYAVSYGDMPPRNQRAVGDEALLDEAVRGMRTDGDVRRVVREEKLTVSGFPAREVEFLANDGGTYIARVIVADTRLYIVIGGGRFVRPGNANVRRFIDSFKVTDPKLKGGKAAADQQKDEAEKKEAARRADEERAAQEAARRAKENEAFRTAEYTGPVPGDPGVLSLTTGDVLRLSLDETDPSGVGAWRQTRPLLKNAAHGPGVRGKAAFLTTGTQAQDIRLYLNESPVRNLPLGLKGFTLSGWYKARHRAFDLFWVAVPTNVGSPTGGVHVRVRVEEKSIVAWSRDRGQPLEVSAPRPADDRWHHVAVVFDQTGRDVLVSVYIDGKKVADGAGAQTHLAHSSIWVGYPRSDGADWLSPADPGGKPAAAAADDLIGAIDECCVIDGPLAPADVRKLAGLDPMSARSLKQHGPKFETPFEVPDPTHIAGLRTYFSFEEPDPRNPRDVVGGTAEVKASEAEFVPGPRGRAVRATVSPLYGYGLRYHEGTFTKLGIGIAEGEPFTLAFWVRAEDDKPGPVLLFKSQGWAPDILWYRQIRLARDRKTGDVSFTLSGKTEADNLTAARPGWQPGAWNHVALSRDKDGKFRLSVNGDVKGIPITAKHPIPINFFQLGDGFEAGWRKDTPSFYMEFDEFCIFDRALTDDELAALAGRKELPKK